MAGGATDVYVSYAWKVEEQDRLVDKLEQACERRGIELRRDRNELGYGESIRDFMDKLAAAGSVILVLSEAYFKSPYCMYELREIEANRNFRRRVFPVVVRETRFHSAKDRIPFIRHWEQEKKELQDGPQSVSRVNIGKSSHQELKDYDSFCRLIDDLQALLADMNALTEDVHVGTDFEALLNRLESRLPKTSPPQPWNRKPDANFQRIIRENVQAILQQHCKLGDAVRSKTLEVLGSDPGDPWATLCDTEPVVAIDDVLRPATRQCLSTLDANSAEFADTWEATKAGLAWLSLFSVSRDWIEHEKNHAALAGLDFEIMVHRIAAWKSRVRAFGRFSQD